jgi:hypothetical protein
MSRNFCTVGRFLPWAALSLSSFELGLFCGLGSFVQGHSVLGHFVLCDGPFVNMLYFRPWEPVHRLLLYFQLVDLFAKLFLYFLPMYAAFGRLLLEFQLEERFSDCSSISILTSGAFSPYFCRISNT